MKLLKIGSDASSIDDNTEKLGNNNLYLII